MGPDQRRTRRFRRYPQTGPGGSFATLQLSTTQNGPVLLLNAEHRGWHTGTAEIRNWRHESETGYTQETLQTCRDFWEHFNFAGKVQGHLYKLLVDYRDEKPADNESVKLMAFAVEGMIDADIADFAANAMRLRRTRL